MNMFQVVIASNSDEDIVSEDAQPTKPTEHSMTEVGAPPIYTDINAENNTISQQNACEKKARFNKKRFRALWISDPLFADWLLEKNGQAFCKKCNITLAPGKSELLRHRSTRKHLKTLDDTSSLTTEETNEVPIQIDLRWEPGSHLPDHFCETVKKCKPSGDIREDVRTKELEMKIATLSGKSEGVWFPSPALANHACFSCYKDGGSTQVIVGAKSQMALLERASLQTIPSIQLETIENKADGSYCLSTFCKKIQKLPDGYPNKSIATIEQTHLRKGGRVVPGQWEHELHTICSNHDIDIHMDGGDLYGASESSKRSIEDLSRYCKTATIRTPSLGGAVLVGPSDFMKKARDIRNEEHAMNNSGIMTAVELVSLELASLQAEECRLQAQQFGAVVRSRRSNIAWLEAEVHTNVVLIAVNTSIISLRDFIQGLRQGNYLTEDNKRRKFELRMDEHPPNHILCVFNPHILKYGQRIIEQYKSFLEKLELIVSNSAC